jgi:hypothetical protein
MYNIYQLFLMNHKQLPFNIARSSWGNLIISVDKIDNIRYSAKSWYCDAFTLSETYKDMGYGSAGDYKVIGCAGCYQWLFADDEKEYDESLLPEKAEKKSIRGLSIQRAGKDYICYYCKKVISKGSEYERYSMRSAGETNMPINEVFCVGHRDEMREKHFSKPIDQINFSELLEAWNEGIII